MRPVPKVSCTAPELGARDLRIDFFRGLALLWIFLNHIPGNTFSWLSNRNYGLSDATEIFVFLAGVSCAMAYGKLIDKQGLRAAWKSSLKRAFSIYHAHLVTAFVLLTLSMALALSPAKNDFLAYNLFELLVESIQAGDGSLLTSLFTLTYRPLNLDVLPLYVILIALCVPALLLARKHPVWLALLSIALWMMARQGLNLPDFRPDHGWVFNPFAWQLLFVAGMIVSIHRNHIAPWLTRPLVQFSAWVSLISCSTVVLSWYLEPLNAVIQASIAGWLYPLSKTNLDVMRLLHFSAVLAVLLPRVPAGATWLTHSLARHVARCGRHSLEVFSAGIVLSFIGHAVLAEWSNSLVAQSLVSAAGCAILMRQAAWLERHANAKKRQHTSEPLHLAS